MNKRQIKKEYKKLCDKHNIPYSSFEINRKNHTMKKAETSMVKRMLYNLREIIRIRSFIFKHTINTRYNFNKPQYDMSSWLKEDLISGNGGPRLKDYSFKLNYGSSCASDCLLHRANNRPTDIYDIDESSIIPCHMISIDLYNQNKISRIKKEENSNADECKTDLSV